jgi:hypothetical protein
MMVLLLGLVALLYVAVVLYLEAELPFLLLRILFPLQTHVLKLALLLTSQQWIGWVE